MTLKNALGLAAWLAGSLAAGWIGSQFMPGEWYQALNKPSWTPPGAVFAPVWTVLYLLMGTAAWMVWRKAGFRGAGFALVLFIVQLCLNALWSWLFFGLRRIDIAFFEIVFLWFLILIVTVMFLRENRTSGIFLLPYLLWVGFASCLNFAVWRMNI